MLGIIRSVIKAVQRARMHYGSIVSYYCGVSGKQKSRMTEYRIQIAARRSLFAHNCIVGTDSQFVVVASVEPDWSVVRRRMRGGGEETGWKMSMMMRDADDGVILSQQQLQQQVVTFSQAECRSSWRCRNFNFLSVAAAELHQRTWRSRDFLCDVIVTTRHMLSACFSGIKPRSAVLIGF